VKTDRESIFQDIRRRMEDVGFVFEKEQVPHFQNRKENEHKFIHPRLEKKLIDDGYKVIGKKYYIKPLSDDPLCEIGLVTAKSTPLADSGIFVAPNALDAFENMPAWVNRGNDFSLDNLLLSIERYLKDDGPLPDTGMSFYDWLIDQGRSPKTAKNYSGPMSGKLADHATLIKEPSFDHEQLKSDSQFQNYCVKNDKTGELYALNKRGKDMYRRALVMYSEYVASSANTEISDDFDSKVSRARRDTEENRRQRLKSAKTKPNRSSATVDVFDRNPDVVAEVLLRAEGNCECCNCPAPFIRKSDNTPYLEVHHTIFLAEGGDDTVENAEALCPNCHREKHYGV
jgi:5-methylcytosine-specific restriction endonuclease McrA